ncbi:ORF2 [Mouse astrovirus M-52/USA/2008]|uniref:ORF2 n=1 Tax=Mouse astrovirus M-52/USA/2008 TaxID=1074210 RepID=UPI00021D581D|nr:ORF2 [Mouse astrovirus M-52/USA/2008]AEM05826.1 ORF2 [Mouse astrovirus M-52/USA/2008]
MAGPSDKKVEAKVKREVEKEVKKEVSKELGAKPKQKNWRRKAFKRKEKKEEKRIKKDVKKFAGGPKPKFAVKVTSTLGTIGPNETDGPVLQLSSFLHPSLVKGKDDGTAFGPLQAAAAQFGMWRLSNLEIRFTPLVGGSAAAGTVTRASLNLSQTPSNTGWGGLGARKHHDLSIGRGSNWKLNREDLNGPRNGGWWCTDTNVEGNQSGGPLLEVHSLGTTTSTYKDAGYTGNLFIVELFGRWEFTNYNANPALGDLSKTTEKVNAKIISDPEGVVQMQIQTPAGSKMRSIFADPTVKAEARGVGEIIYQLVNTTADLVANAAPPPWNWLVRGGWFFLKKIASSSNGIDTFNVYPSLADAQNNKPAISTQKNHNAELQEQELTVTQFNAPNLGGGTQVVQVKAASGGDVFPIKPTGVPRNEFILNAYVTPVYMLSSPYNPRFIDFTSIVVGNKKFAAMHFHAQNVHLVQFNQDQQVGFYDVNELPVAHEFELDQRCIQNGTQVMQVLASATAPIAALSGGQIWSHTVLWKPKNEGPDWQTLDNAQGSWWRPGNNPGDNWTRAWNTGNYTTQIDMFRNLFLTNYLSNVANPFQLERAEPVTQNFVPNGGGNSFWSLQESPWARGDHKLVSGQMEIHPKKLTKFEKLCKKLGIDPCDFDDDSSSTTDNDPDSSDDDDFENVTTTSTQEKIETLMRIGITPEEAKKLVQLV